MKALLFYVVLAATTASTALAAPSDSCGTREKAYATSVNLGGRSFHPESKYNYYEWNVMVGVRQYIGCVPFMTTARGYLEGDVVHPNSLGGTAKDVGVGVQWGPRFLRFGDYQAGLEMKVGKMWYSIPTDNPRHPIPYGVTLKEEVFMGGPFIQKGSDSVHVTILQKPRDFIQLKWKKAKAIFVSYNHEF